MASFEIAWQAPEYEFREKGVSWYWTSIAVAAVIVAFSVWEKNFLFGLFIVVAEVLFIVWGNRPPRLVGFSITDAGVAIEGGKTYSFKEFISMSASDEENGWADLVFIFHARFKSPLKILFPSGRLAELRAALKPLVKEVPYESTVLDAIEKILRF